ncbi:MAG TPA: hypothetical protein VKH81_03990 [Candidatus Angelobacter sp.]|nr:hypothetical protein [Candidatus Angelobacter sp.]
MNRPTGVTLIAVLYFLGAAFAALGGIGMVAGGGMLASMMNQQGAQAGPMAGIIASFGAAVGIFFLVMAAIDVLLGIGLIKLKEWARLTTVILTAIFAALGALGLLKDLTHFVLFSFLISAVVVALQVWIVVYLLKPEVKAAFQGPQARTASA